MMRRTFAALALVCACACDGQQYVSPDTLALVITNVTKEDAHVTRVNRCHYVPVLLGSQVKARYSVEEGLHATITITRDTRSVVFDDDGTDLGPLDEEDPNLEYRGRRFSVVFRSDCTPDDR
jgi:hypothetical protein